MMQDAIREALGTARDAWAEVEADGYGLDPEQKLAVQKEIDDAILALEEAGRLALVELS